MEKNKKVTDNKLYSLSSEECEMGLKLIYIDPDLMDLANGITYKRAILTRWEKIKIFFRFMKEPKRIKVKEKMLCDLLPKVKFNKTGWIINNGK